MSDLRKWISKSEPTTMLTKCLVNKMKCVFCGSTKHANEERLQSKRIDRQLRQWQKAEERIVKLLLLGIGESGKSTITKQMRIIHIGDFTDSERLEKVPDIRRNVKDAILIIVGAMSNLGIPLANQSLCASVQFIMTKAIEEDFTYTQEFYTHVSLLWADAGVQQCYSRSNEYQLFDSAKYFLDRVDEIRTDDYIPSDQDLLRCRVMTNTIQRIDFKAMDDKTAVNFSVFDVGGQQGMRRKWIQVFDQTTAILFVVDCSCFDQTLREETSTNRFLESLETFEQVWNNRFLRQTPVVLFLNKIDLLREKISQGRTLDKLVDSLDPKHHYYELLQTFKTFDKLKESERREFIEAFPVTESESSPAKCDSNRTRRGKKRMSTQPAYRQDIDETVIRTAVFIKRIFMHLVHNPIHQTERRSDWHNGHSCEYFYTCAVDTQTIRKVLEGCRTLIIKKVLEKWGM